MGWFTNRTSAARSSRHLFGWSARNGDGQTSGDGAKRSRRAHRVDLNTPIFLYGSMMNGEPFSECSVTIDVSINGALVSVNVRLFPEQRILLTNLRTEQDLKCRVVRLDKSKKAAALEFLEPSPRFWCIDFASAAAAKG